MDDSTMPPLNEPAGELPPELLRRLKVVIPGYKLISEIARGGQGIIYKAKQEKTHRIVAIKLLREGSFADDDARERLKREARALTAIKHPNIVAMIDSGETVDGHDYLVMAYVEGRPLNLLFPDFQRIDYATFDPSFLLRLFLKICDAVNAAHLVGITHRDLSPSNILVDHDDEPFILDFGLARSAFDRFFNAGQYGPSISGQFLGKVAYASPEQAKCKPDSIDIRTDVYALGVILYQILTGGQFPYEVVGGIADILNNIVKAKPLPPSERLRKTRSRVETTPSLHGDHAPRINATMEAIVLKALEKEPSRRYQSAGALGDEIRKYLAGQPTIAYAMGKLPPISRGRSARPFVAAASLAACIVLTAAWRYYPRENRRQERSQSVEQREPVGGSHTHVVSMAADLLDRAAAAPAEAERKALGQQAKQALMPLVSDLELADPDIWKLVARVSIVFHDSSLATMAVEALRRLENESLRDPLLQSVEQLIDDEELDYWSDRRSALLGVFRQAKGGNAKAMGQIGQMFYEGSDGLPVDYEQAERWSERGASAGDDISMCILGALHLRIKSEVAKNEKEALRWFTKASNAGSGLAMAYLGLMHADGRCGFPKSDRTAVEWYRKGAAAGSGRAMSCLGTMCEEGRGGMKLSSVGAMEWFRQAADAGDAEGLYHLANAYLRGSIGVASRDEGKALRLFKNAAHAGSVAAMRDLGSIYDRGLGGVARSLAHAVRWYRRAAQRGDLPAQIWLKQHNSG